MAELPEIKATSTASSVSVRSLHRGGDTTQEGICVL
nr:MAG TPA: hypothetical protein [Caudoviricetes sp.]